MKQKVCHQKRPYILKFHAQNRNLCQKSRQQKFVYFNTRGWWENKKAFIKARLILLFRVVTNLYLKAQGLLQGLKFERYFHIGKILAMLVNKEISRLRLQILDKEFCIKNSYRFRFKIKARIATTKDHLTQPWLPILTSTSHSAFELVAEVADCLPVVLRKTCCFFLCSSQVRNFSCSAWNSLTTSPYRKQDSLVSTGRMHYWKARSKRSFQTYPF